MRAIYCILYNILLKKHTHFTIIRLQSYPFTYDLNETTVISQRHSTKSSIHEKLIIEGDMHHTSTFLFLRCERLFRCETTNHVKCPLWLIIGHHMACITHHYLDQAWNLSHIPGHLVIYTPNVALGFLVLISILPLEGIQKILGECVGDDNVQLAIVNQHLVMLGIQQLRK